MKNTSFLIWSASHIGFWATLSLIGFGGWLIVFAALDQTDIYATMQSIGAAVLPDLSPSLTWGIFLLLVGGGRMLSLWHEYRHRGRYWLSFCTSFFVAVALLMITTTLTVANPYVTSTPTYAVLLSMAALDFVHVSRWWSW